MSENKSCYGCKHSYWVSDRGYSSLYCPIKDEHDTGERHIQGKINITDCWELIPPPKKCSKCGQVVKEVDGE